MTEIEVRLIVMLCYKLIVVFCGLACIYLGYKLFVKGVFSDAGEINATFSNKKLLIKKAAPGTFFALFGFIIIVVATWREMSVKTEKPDGSHLDTTVTLAPPPADTMTASPPKKNKNAESSTEVIRREETTK